MSRNQIMLRAWRKKISILLSLTLVFVSMLGVQAAESPQNILTYQGRVLNSNGVPVADTSLSMTFDLYAESSGGSSLWSSGTQTVSLTSGLFTEELGGSGYPSITDTVFANDGSVYLEVTIGAETLTPRKLLTAAPYALNAQSLDGIDSTGFLAATGDTATGDYDLTGAELTGGSPLTFEGTSNDGVTTTFAFVDPKSNRTITFQDASGTVAFTSDITGSLLWESGANGSYEDDAATIVGSDSAFTYVGSAAAGDLKIGDDFEAIGRAWIGESLVIGASVSPTETLANTGFIFGTDDLFVAGLIGSEGSMYTDGSFNAGTDTSFGSGFITTTGTTDLLLTIAGGDLAFAQNTTIGDGGDTIAINTSDWDISSTGEMTGLGDIYTDGTLIQGNGALNLTAAGTLNVTSGNGSGLTLAADNGASAAETVAITGYNFQVATSGNITTIGDLAVNGQDITSTSDLRLAQGTGNGISIGSGTVESVTIGNSSTNQVFITTDSGTPYQDIYFAGGMTVNDETVFDLGQGENLWLKNTAATTSTALLDLDITTDTTNNGNVFGEQIAMVLTNYADDGDADTRVALDLTVTNNASDAGTDDDIYAMRINNFTGAQNDGNEYAMSIGTGWDADITFNNSAARLQHASSGSIGFYAGTSNSATLLIQDVSNSSNHQLLTDSNTALTFKSQTDATDIDISTYTDESLKMMGNGTGDIILHADSDSNVQISSLGAPASPILQIDNSSNPATTNSAGGLSVTHSMSNASGGALQITPAFTGGAVDSQFYRGILVNGFSPTNASGIDNVFGMEIATLTDPGATINSRALELGSGWDTSIFFEDSSTDILIVDGGTIAFKDAFNNTLMSIIDSGTTGTIEAVSLGAPDDNDLMINGGSSTSVGSSGKKATITGGVNTAGGSGGSGGAVSINGGAAAGDGTVARDGGSVEIKAGASSISTGKGGDVTIYGGSSTSGTDGNVLVKSGSLPTTPPSIDGDDVLLAAGDDIVISAADDVDFMATSTGSIINMFDDPNTKTIDIGSVTTDAADTVKISTNSSTADNIQIGNTAASTVFSLYGGNKWFIASSGTANFTYASNSAQYALCHAVNGAGTGAIEDCVGSVTADYAEQYPVEEGITYGDIVVPGTTEVTTTQGDTVVQLTKSYEAYQGPVVGIVSDNYGDFTSAGYNIEEDDNPMPIALVGRVPVNVTSEGGSIQAGDYLTTSSTPGAAMKATQVGRVIGMALEDWDGVSSTVMVQVNNSWSMGDVIGTDGTSTLITDTVVVAPISEATSTETTFNSYGLALRGSAWNGSEEEAVEMMLQNSVDSDSSYRLSVHNTSETEVAYITNEGTMKIAGDMVIGGNIYPSDRGTPQTDKYIYYDGSTGVGGDFMRTNAKGWSTGSYDFAEMFPSNEALVAGDIVAFTNSGENVSRATGSDSEQLAGIVSTRPGFLAGENIEGSHPIALAGRVPTKVSLENGEIAVGDPLTASSTPGVAMKATEPGQIVGYALETYTSSASDNFITTYVNVGYWSGAPTSSMPGTNTQASGFAPSGTTSYSGLNMSGNIFMATNNILSIGRLEGISNLWSIETDGTIKTTSLLKTSIDSYQGTKVETIAVTSPEAIITLSGTTQLHGGIAEVRFESISAEFNDVISAEAPIRVVVTPSGPVSLYVDEKDQNHFTVKRFAGSADVEFDWIVTAYRKGYEPEETEEVDTESSGITDSGTQTETETETTEPEESSTEESAAETEETQDPETQTPQEETQEVTEEETPVIEEEVVQDEQPTEEEIVVEEEPATPESPVETIVDSTTESEGGASAEELLTEE